MKDEAAPAPVIRFILQPSSLIPQGKYMTAIRDPVRLWAFGAAGFLAEPHGADNENAP
jgi:hypothetical protein